MRNAAAVTFTVLLMFKRFRYVLILEVYSLKYSDALCFSLLPLKLRHFAILCDVIYFAVVHYSILNGDFNN